MKLPTLGNRLLAAALLLVGAQALTPLRAEAPVVSIWLHLVRPDGHTLEYAVPGDNPNDIRACQENVRAMIDNNQAVPGSYCFVVAK